MEFEHVGLHCSVCRRKDFLPVKCDRCLRHFCQPCIGDDHHRSLCQNRDMTSFDCPVCGKSVKHDRAEDINEVWSLHYATSCSQSEVSSGKGSAKTAHCAYSQCRKQLGPSNRFSCPRCRREVCLAHRMPESHECSAIVKGGPSRRAPFATRDSDKKKPTGPAPPSPVEVR